MSASTTVDRPTAADHPFEDIDTAPVVVAPEEPGGPGAWAGAPCALRVGDDIYLAYRLRRPVGQGRGYANVVARSADGVRFTTVATVGKDAFGAESLERPALVVTADGRWRLYVSVATPGTKHWRVDLLEAEHPGGAGHAPTPSPSCRAATELAVKDPVIVRHDGRWHAVGVLPPARRPRGHRPDDHRVRHERRRRRLDLARHRARRPGRAAGTPAASGSRAVRLDGPEPLAWYDGRATAEQNWEEQTGLAAARRPGRAATAVGDAPVGVSPHGLGGLRYVSLVSLPTAAPGSTSRSTRPDGAHDLRTVRPCADRQADATTPDAASRLLRHRRPQGRAPPPCTSRWRGTRSCSCRGSRSPSTSSPTARRRPAGAPATRRRFREYVWRREDYEALFDRRPRGHPARRVDAVLPATTTRRSSASWTPCPGARMIALLRDPVDRAHSNWTHLWSAGLEPEGDFLQACALEERRAAPGLGAVLALPRPRPVRRAAASGCTRCSRASRCSCCATATCASAPVETLDVIFGFLGVETGVVDEIPAENVTTHVTDSPRNRLISGALRVGSRAGHGRLAPAWRPVADWLSRHLQREQNLRRPLEREPAGGAAAPGGRRRTAAGGGDRRPVRRLAGRRARAAAGVAAAGGQDRHRATAASTTRSARPVLDAATTSPQLTLPWAADIVVRSRRPDHALRGR